METSKVKVLYVMGHGGSGSTILGNVLGELNGFFHAGELDTLWALTKWNVSEAARAGVPGVGGSVLKLRL